VQSCADARRWRGVCATSQLVEMVQVLRGVWTLLLGIMLMMVGNGIRAR
jgi:hypothetical protein